MDVEIVKQNGQSFRLSDYGVVQDFVVHSIDRSVVRDPIDGRSGSADYGVEIGDRTIEVPMIFKAADLHDYAHLRDELYGLLDDSEPFYIREMRRPKSLQYDFADFGQKPKWEAQTDNEYVNGKQYKVRLNSTLTPEQRSLSGEVSIEFVTSGLPYAETIYTTLELHDSGYSATAEKYGLVDNIDDEKVKYRFNQATSTKSLSTLAFEQGMIAAATGLNAYSVRHLRSTGYYSIKSGASYTFEDLGDNPNVSNWWIFIYNDSNARIETISTYNQSDKKLLKFTASGSKMRVFVEAATDSTFSVSDIGSSIKPSLIEPSDITNFTVYNAGNVTVEPESMLLNINVNAVRSDNNFTIRNKTTGEEIVLERASTGSHFRVQGMVISLGSITNVFRDTNRRFIGLVPGDNQFEILNGTFEEIRFEFNFLYK